MKDQIKIYSSFECFDAKCSACSKITHFAFQCPRVHFMPDKDFLIRKTNFSALQQRKITPLEKRRQKFHALKNLVLVQTKADRHNRKNLEESDSSSCGEEPLKDSEIMKVSVIESINKIGVSNNSKII